jgi:hypothetical protein
MQHQLKIGDALYVYTTKYELYYKIVKNFYLDKEYIKLFNNLKARGDEESKMVVPFVNGIKSTFDTSENRTNEWKTVINAIRNNEYEKKVAIDVEAFNKDYSNIKVDASLKISEERFIKNKTKSKYLPLFDKTHPCSMSISKFVTIVQGAKISDGIQLEGVIYEEFKYIKYEKLKFNEAIKIMNEAADNDIILIKKVIINREFMVENSTFEFTRSENLNLDFMVKYNKTVYVNELKDGDNLDTKKSDIEIREIQRIKELTQSKLVDLDCEASIILWRCNDLKEASIKSLDANMYIVTGRHFANVIGVDYDLINAKRYLRHVANVDFTIDYWRKVVDMYDNYEKNKK